MKAEKRHWAIALLLAAIFQLLIVAAIYQPAPIMRLSADSGLEILLGSHTPAANTRAPATPANRLNNPESQPPSSAPAPKREKQIDRKSPSDTIRRALQTANPAPTSPADGSIKRKQQDAIPVQQIAKSHANHKREAQQTATAAKRPPMQKKEQGERLHDGMQSLSERAAEKSAAARTRNTPEINPGDGTILHSENTGTENLASRGNPTQAHNEPSSTYYQSITSWLERHKRYPRRAIKRRQQGTVKLTFTIDRAGNLLSQRIASSSGHPLLDKEANAMLRRASPMPAIPSDFSNDVLEISLPVRFALR